MKGKLTLVAGLLAFALTPLSANAWWLTGGGIIVTDALDISFGIVVQPADKDAAGGGNINVVDHLEGLHFKGLEITEIADVTDAVSFRGTGTLAGIGGNPMAETPVLFEGVAVDKGEPGAGADELYLWVYVDDGTTVTTLMLINGSTDPLVIDPLLITTGNLQLHDLGGNKK